MLGLFEHVKGFLENKIILKRGLFHKPLIYFRYFEWTKTYTNRKFGFDYSPICKICEYATKQFEGDRKNILNLDKFWNVNDCNKFDVEKFLKNK
ncbi:unnamed protein product [Meloidogyne enterolobii]|uniref:Uncharacterized protein n=1 Tax=Meloidogyne enterolobii TaxID=390850 RepID=A0ACB0YBT0_MELEN